MSWSKERFLQNLDEEDKIYAAKVFDQVELIDKTKQPRVMDFVEPTKLVLVEEIIKNTGGLICFFSGGYKQAERKRPVLAPDFYPRELIDAKLKAIEVKGNFSFRPTSHRDFLGSILGLGIKREKVGDIILIDNGCQVITTDEIGDFLLIHLSKVGRVPVESREIDLDQLEVKAETVKEIKTTVVSLRLDAVASFGFSTSRTKMAEQIKGDRVKVNWKVVNNPAYQLKEGDVLSIRGRGRVVLEAVLGETKKGRKSILLKRYL